MLLAVLTVSDRCSQRLAIDASGPAVAAFLRRTWPDAEIHTALVPDEIAEIGDRLIEWSSQGAALILTTGGTGLGPRDWTPEATRQIIDREAPGIAEAMRAQGAENNPLAWLSRGVAGLKGRTLIVNLPGSPRGAEESVIAILPLIRHGLETIAGTESHS
ncbi:MAG: molybdenum cofactor biosynthesis protein B [Terracidiphilus sp.]